MPLEEEGDGDAGLYNTVYRGLQHPVRRRVLFSLLDHNPQRALLVPEDVHVGEKEIRERNIELVHHHLPLLAEAGLIRWDRENGQLHKGAEFAKVESLIEAIRENDPLSAGDWNG